MYAADASAAAAASRRGALALCGPRAAAAALRAQPRDERLLEVGGVEGGEDVERDDEGAVDRLGHVRRVAAEDEAPRVLQQVDLRENTAGGWG
eukprot:5707446-Prymnesium_polylepis.1